MPIWQGDLLPPPIHRHGKDSYSIAVFHQLHCLHGLTEILDGFLFQRPRASAQSLPDSSTEQEMMVKHVRHCLEYIRNAVTCCADTTLEGQSQSTVDAGSDGFSAYHVCRNLDPIFHWATSNRASDMVGYNSPTKTK